MSVSKRRLSSGNGLVGGIPFADDDEEEDEKELDVLNNSINSMPRRQSGSGRRGSRSFLGSMMGSNSPPLNPLEQTRIAEMYKTVIQMSSENKLNEKNSWNYDLIDHMGKLIKDEGQGVNFQKASCTLDASVKIYSNRVDDTYTTSHRILESLSRNGNNNANDDGDGDVEGEAGAAKPKARVGTKASSNRLNVAQTIERNPAVLNAVKLENDYAVDPLFHKMSKAFDEGGAKGMLMNNLRLSRNASAISFCCKDLGTVGDRMPPAPTESADKAAQISDMVDISDLISRAGINLSELSQLSICPAFDTYRAQIGVPELSEGYAGLLEPIDIAAISAGFGSARFSLGGASRPSYGSSAGIAESSGENNYQQYDDGGDVDMDDGGDNDYCPPEAHGDTWVDESGDATAGRTSTSSAVRTSLSGGSPSKSKLRWDDILAANGQATVTPAQEDNLVADSIQNLLSENAGLAGDYAIFDVDALVSNNTWAGARHWKYATRHREAASKAAASKAAVVQQPVEVDDVVAGEEPVEADTAIGKKRKSPAAPSKAKGSKKEVLPIDFSLSLVDEADFDLPAKGKRDTTLQTAAAIEKLNSESERDSLLLPHDAKVQLKDLCRLFLAPRVIVPPAQFHSIVQASIQKSRDKMISSSSLILEQMYPDEGRDVVWGKGIVSLPQQATAYPGNALRPQLDTAAEEEAPGGDFYDDGDNDYGDEGTGDMGGYFPAEGSESVTSQLVGLSINQSSLLQASRTVEKIEIDYAKVSKRVNIQRLKTDIWSDIEHTLGVDGAAEGRVPTSKGTDAASASPSEKPESMSFQSMISDIASQPRQKDVSLPFYFICLLHLANEHGLRIEDREDMSDLVISMDSK